jgi:hypothetical protein
VQKAFLILLIFICSGGYFYACSEAPVDEETNYLGEFTQSDRAGKADDINGAVAIPISADYSDTAVWEVYNDWQDFDTPEANKAGPAWSQDSGLDWDQKYHLWVKSLPKIEDEDIYKNKYVTFSITNPQGKTLPAPVLDCSEVAMFLRVTFASWYHLPFFMEAKDSRGTRVFMGHFGWRTASGRYANSPRFKTAYQDFGDGEYNESIWPRDEKLREKEMYKGDDVQSFLSFDAHVGQYFDELYLNKRVGHFLVLLLGSFNSKNLSDAANTFNLQPEAIKEGDFVLERWARDGVGHTMVVKSVEPGKKEGSLRVEHVSGSMPRRQPRWMGDIKTLLYFITDETGSLEYNEEGDQYVKLGGGLKRWRVATQENGFYANTILPSDVAYWINSSDYQALGARPKKFEEILEVSDVDKYIEVLISLIEDSRFRLLYHPSSCSARIWREKVFGRLYKVLADERGLSTKEVDIQYRRLEDYVFAELAYTQSKTCCWNSTSYLMYQIIMTYSHDKLRTEPVCQTPTVFKYEFGYDVFKDYAERLGLDWAWTKWSEDESCPQRGVAQDMEALHEWTDFCEIRDSMIISPDYCCYLDYETEQESDYATMVSQAKHGQKFAYGPAHICSFDDIDYYEFGFAHDVDTDPESINFSVSLNSTNPLSEYEVFVIYKSDYSNGSFVCGGNSIVSSHDTNSGCKNTLTEVPVVTDFILSGWGNDDLSGMFYIIVKHLNDYAICDSYELTVDIK